MNEKMIHIIENYYASVTDYGYTLLEDTGKVDKENKPVYKTHGYYGSLEETLKWLIRKRVPAKLKNGTTELSEALAIIVEAREEVMDAIYEKEYAR